MIVSSNVEFNSDQMTLLNVAEDNGGWLTFTNVKSKVATFNNAERFKLAIDQLLMEGLAWEDDHSLHNPGSTTGVYTKGPEDKGMCYWFPTLMKNVEEDDDKEAQNIKI